jgi:hypothetical protein
VRFRTSAHSDSQTSKTGGCRFESYRPCPVEYARASWKKPRSHGLFAFSGSESAVRLAATRARLVPAFCF